jgi:Trk K+ transport system NAD-binding subunit
MRIGIVGAGRVGRALSVVLVATGHKVMSQAITFAASSGLSW